MVSDNKAASMFFLKENAVCFGALGTDSSANILEISNGKSSLIPEGKTVSKFYWLTAAISWGSSWGPPYQVSHRSLTDTAPSSCWLANGSPSGTVRQAALSTAQRYSEGMLECCIANR